MKGPPNRPGEFELIARYFAPLSRAFPGAAGLADDTATLAIGPGMEAVVTLDTMIAGIHFLPGDPPDLVARKLIRVNLSDLAAAGARPLVYFLATSFAPDIDESWVAGFARGLEADQALFDIALGGGDTTATPGPLTLSLTAIGEVPAGTSAHRFGAEPGQDIYVSGTIGDAALALALMEAHGVDAALARAPGLVARYRLPEPRVALGCALRGAITAAMDISDGLLADLGHICDVSGVGADVSFGAIPLSPEAASEVAADPALAERVVAGGDDYELLFVAKPEAAGRIEAIARSVGVPVVRIGRTNAAGRPVITGPSGQEMAPAAPGWRHF